MSRARSGYAAAPRIALEESSSEVRPNPLGKPCKGYEKFVDEVVDDDDAHSMLGRGNAFSEVCVSWIDGHHEACGEKLRDISNLSFDITEKTADSTSMHSGLQTGNNGSPVGGSAPDNTLVPSGEAQKQKLRCGIVILTLNSALGGFLFGYDTGVVSGAMLQIKTKVHGLGDLSHMEQEIIVSSTVGGAIAGSLLSGELQKRLYFGRKGMILIGDTLFIVGTAIMTISWCVPVLTLGRLLVGVAVGIVSHSVPLYITECVPVDLRGRLNALNSIFVVLGQVVASLVCCVIARAQVSQGWRWMLGIGGLPAILMGVGFQLLPESPRYILLRGKGDEVSRLKAAKVLTTLRGRNNKEMVETECSSAIESLKADPGSKSLLETLQPRGIRRALALGVSLQLLQQLSGINTLMYYSGTIMQMSSAEGDLGCRKNASDVGDGNYATSVADPNPLEGVREICLTTLVAMSQLVGTIGGMFLVDRLGRRPLTLGSLGGVVVSLFVLGLTFHPDGLKVENGPLWGMLAYLVCFGVGMSPLPWIVNSEIYPLHARSVCIGIATASNWIANFVVSATFIDLAEALSSDTACPASHPDGAFWLYAAVAAMGFAVLFFQMPETKGLSLEEICDLFEDGGRDPGRAPEMKG
eukprot:TRINITY_DN55890_c0_g1_i1.p1 TRINITY_DN55890_c0_g1~~TRINITY_DN55890_c0_g1_i1.p1  ORF type:complete len:638 (-),score=72.80 TRINITY_DN55890_c0_g1_i1:46-1959(-)